MSSERNPTSVLTCDVNVHGVVQYVGTGVPELQLIEWPVGRYYNISAKNVILDIPIWRFLGKYISANLSWATNSTAIVKKVEQRLRILKQNQLPGKLLVYFYSVPTRVCCCPASLCGLPDPPEGHLYRPEDHRLPSLHALCSSCCLSRAANTERPGGSFRSIVSWINKHFLPQSHTRTEYCYSEHWTLSCSLNGHI